MIVKIAIRDDSRIMSIQEEFHTVFPYLKLEFVVRPYAIDGGIVKKRVMHNSKTIGDCRRIQNKQQIFILPQMTVYELEHNFRDVYGLSVHVFRRSGKAWLETTVTDGWSLDEQNRQGEALSKLPA